MPQAKKTLKTPIKNRATTGKPTTPSGSGVVIPQPRGNGNTKKRQSTAAAANASPSKEWWHSVEASRTDPKAISADLHRMADSIFRPVGADADRPTGRRSSLPDQRLYADAPNGRGAKANGRATAPKNKSTAKTTAKSPPRTKAAGMRTRSR